jgi:hypothetical protein
LVGAVDEILRMDASRKTKRQHRSSYSPTRHLIAPISAKDAFAEL